MNTLLIISLPPWRLAGALDELIPVCRNAGAGRVALMVQAHPEMPPYLDKIHAYVERFVRLQAALAPEDLSFGFLLQQTLGHGDRNQPISPVPFQRMVAADGVVSPACFCPLDEGFAAHLADAVMLMARARPDFLLVDDDFRLEWHVPGRVTCLCPLHLAALGARTGRTWTREQLVEQAARADETGLALRRQWQEVLDDSLLGLAARIRRTVDAVDPNLRCGFCSVSIQRLLHERVARVLAGKTRPWLRINAPYYGREGFQQFPNTLARMQQQQAGIGSDVETMSEADTCPHTRYSMSALSLRAFMTGASLMGLSGHKLWITNTMDWRFEESRAYQDMLRESRAYLEAAARLGQSVTWLGPVALSSGQELWRRPWSASAPSIINTLGWSTLCGRFGIPFRSHGQGLVMLEGEAPDGFEDDDLRRLLSKGVLLDGPAAQCLSARGFDDLLGIHAEHEPQTRLSLEQFEPDQELNGAYAGIRRDGSRGQPNAFTRLTPLSDAVRIGSWLMRWPWHMSEAIERVAPALTLFENRLGGRVAAYAFPCGGGGIFTPFLNPARQTQLRGVLGWLSRESLPVAVDHNADVTLFHGICEGENVLAVFNLGPDPMTSLRLIWNLPVPNRFLTLADDGAWQPLAFTAGPGGSMDLAIAIPVMRPLLLRVQVKGRL
jgi:hypothetical protein